MNKKGIHIIVVVVLLSLHLFIFGENKKEPQATFKLEKAAESKAFFDMGFVSVSNMAVDLSGNVFLLDSGKRKIVKLDRDLKFKAMFGDKGQGPGEFSRSYSISVDKKGNVYVHNTFIKMIRYSGDGKLIDETRISNSYNGTYGFVLNHPVYVLSKMSLSKNFKVMVVDISKKKILSEFAGWFECDHHIKPDKEILHFRHDMGPKWSMYLSAITEGTFNSLLDKKV